MRPRRREGREGARNRRERDDGDCAPAFASRPLRGLRAFAVAFRTRESENNQMIACVGTTPVYQRSMVFERLQTNGVNRARAVWDYASGKAVNVARVLHALGEPAVVSGFAGGDRGAAMLRDLDAAGIRHAFAVVDAPTRQCVTMIDESDGTATELVEESRPLGPADWQHLYETLAKVLP